MTLNSGSFKKEHKKIFCEGNVFKKGHKQFNSGRTWFKEQENILYRGIHSWMVRKYGQPTKCEDCGKDGLTGRQIDWANSDHKYRRVREDYLRLCKKCHRKYDKVHNQQNLKK